MCVGTTTSESFFPSAYHALKLLCNKIPVQSGGGGSFTRTAVSILDRMC